jgi:hypothetical protein
MVSVVHSPGLGLPELEYADIVRVTVLDPQGLPGPTGVRAARAGYTRPQVLDGPAMESIGVAWDRPPTFEPVPLAFEKPLATAYAIGRFEPANGIAEVMLSERPDRVGGFLSYLPARGLGSDALCQFTDHVERGNAAVAGFTFHYAVAAQDLYGRWSPWVDAQFDAASENPQQPHVLSVNLTLQGALTVDFSWDWSDRSPEYIELMGFFTDAGAPIVVLGPFRRAG